MTTLNVRPLREPIAREVNNDAPPSYEATKIAAPVAATQKAEQLKKLARAPVELVCPAGIIHEAMAMKDGYVKYGYASYLNDGVPMTARECIRAAQRHLLRLQAGEDLAPDSKAHHAAHARAMLGIYLECMEAGTLIDDRHPRGKKDHYVGRLLDRIATAA